MHWMGQEKLCHVRIPYHGAPFPNERVFSAQKFFFVCLFQVSKTFGPVHHRCATPWVPEKGKQEETQSFEPTEKLDMARMHEKRLLKP